MSTAAPRPIRARAFISRCVAIGTFLAPGAVLTACGTAGGNGATAQSTTSTVDPAMLTVSPMTGPSSATIRTSSTVIIQGSPVAVPTQYGGRPVSPLVDDGQQVIISATGFMPVRLFSAPGAAVTWTNLTNQSEQVMFDHLAVSSPVISPGGTWSWTTVSSQSISYHSVTGLHGVVTVNPRIS